MRKLISQNISVYKTQKEFTENASHELQTPLAIIKNKLDLLLQKEALTDRQYDIIEEANRALTRITRVNKNLLLLARIENHQFDENEAISMSTLVEQCTTQLAEHFDHKSISILPEIGNHVIADGNKTLIEILLNNLLINAIRHNQQNGTVKISLNQGGITIANSGHSPLDHSAIFKRFAKTSTESAGSGLGLAIIQQICHRHQWTVHYQFEQDYHIFSVRF